MSGPAVSFDQSSAARIAKVVRDAEAKGAPGSGPPPGAPTTHGTFWAQITGYNTSQGAYSWEKMQLSGGVLTTDTSVSPDGFYDAFETNGNAGLPTGLNVELRFAGYNSSNGSIPAYVFSFGSSLTWLQLGSSIGNGVYNGNVLTGAVTAWNQSAGTLTGLTVGAACLIVNGPEFGTTSTVPMLDPSAGNGKGPLKGSFEFNDPATGKPVYWISGAAGGCS